MEKFFEVQDGIYVLKSENDDYIAVGDSETGWEVRFGKNLVSYKSLYGFLGGDVLDEEGKKCILGLAYEWFSDTNTLWDKEYMVKKHKLIKEYFVRVQKIMKEQGAKEDDIAIVGSLVGKA